NDDRDMWQEMRLVLRLHREPGMDDGVPTSAGVFEMATAGGAATTGFGAAIGRLAPGAAADLVLLPWASLATPYLDPVTAPIDALVHRARAIPSTPRAAAASPPARPAARPRRRGGAWPPAGPASAGCPPRRRRSRT